MIKRNMRMVAKDCRNKPVCYLIQGPMALAGGALTDVPYYTVKGVGYGLYYGGIGLGKGIAYTGRAIGRGLAYPFNRPPKPMRVPTTWEQYKHDVIKLQKRLTKADKSNKANQRWCVSRVPLSASANRSEWEARCNPGDAVSRAGLPPDVLAPAPAVVETAAVAASPAPTPVLDSPASTASTPPAVPVSTADEAVTPPPAVTEEAAALPVAAPPAGDPVPAAPDAPSSAVDTVPAQDLAQQKEVQTGVEPAKAGLDPAVGAATPPLTAITPFDKASAGFADGKVAITGATPVSLSERKPLRTLPSGTPANSLTPSEYGFEGRKGYAVKYNQVWGPATPAESFIEKWNPMQSLTSVRKSINETLRDRGTPLAKETAWEKTKELVADLLKRIRGSANIVDRTKDTQPARNVIQGYSEKLLEDDLALMNAAADGKAEHLLEANEEKLNRAYADLQKNAVESTMGQVGDPLEHVKENALEKTEAAFPSAAPKYKPFEESTIYHWADDLGHGGSKAKVVH